MLGHLRTIGPDGQPTSLETQFLSVQTCDADGRLVHMVNFDPDDRAAAYDELRERFIAGEGAAFADLLRASDAWMHSYEDRDLDAQHATLSDDIVVVDHRHVSFGEVRGRDAYSAYFESGVGTSRGVRHAHVADYLRLTPTTALVQATVRSISPDGVEADTSRLVASRIRDGRFDRIDYYPLERFDDALARFEELGGPRPDESRLVNDATRAIDEVIDATLRADWDRVAAIHAPVVTLEDRRAGLQALSTGPDAFLEQSKTIHALGIDEITSECLAVRGRKLALDRRTFRLRDFEAVALMVSEVDDEGRYLVAVVFEPDDLDAALDLLDERYAAGEGAANTESIRFSAAVAAATNDPTAEALRPLTHDDVVLVDHRPASFGEVVGIDDFLRLQRTWTEIFDIRHAYVSRRIAEASDRALGETHITGTTKDGASIDTSRLVLAIYDDKLKRIEYFPLDQEEQALARFHELGPRPDDHLDNACVRRMREVFVRFEREDWRGLLDLYGPHHVTEDVRSGLRSTYAGPEAQVENLKAMHSVGGRLAQLTPLAVRGDHLALMRYDITGPPDGSGFDSAVLVLGELGRDGGSGSDAVFESDDIDAATAALDERFVGAEGRPYALEVGIWSAVVRALNAQDFVALRALFSDTFRLVDHRNVSLGEISDPDEYLGSVQALSGEHVRSDTVAFHRLATGRVLVQLVNRFRTAGDTETERWVLMLASFDAGLVSEFEVFEYERLDDALGRFDELERSSGPLVNDATRAVDTVIDASLRQDWDAIAAIAAPGAIFDDRRTGLKIQSTDVDEYVTQAKTIGALGIDSVTSETLAIRGRRLVLDRRTFLAQESGFETVVLMVGELDEDGRSVRTVVFDPEDRDAAFEELDSLYIAGEGSAFADELRHGVELVRDWNRRDWDAFTSHFVEDIVFVDRRPMPLPDMHGLEEVIPWAKALVTPDTRHEVVAIHTMDERAGVFQYVSRGTNAEGGEVETTYLHVTAFRDGLAARTERFAIDDLEAALARCEELRSGSGPTDDEEARDAGAALENESFRVARASVEARIRGDWDALAALLAADATVTDRRSGLQAEWTGRAEVVAQARAIADVGVDAIDHQCLAVRGRSLSLDRRTYRTRDPQNVFEVVTLTVNEIDAEGLYLRGVVFAADDIRGGFAELDERYAAGEGAHVANYVRLQGAMSAAITAGDWDTYRSLLADDVVVVDHRPASMGEFTGADELVRRNRTLSELMGGALVAVVEFLRVSGATGVQRLAVHGRNSEGGDVDLDTLIVVRIDGGKGSRFEYFALDALDDALACFEQLVTPPGPHDDHPCLRFQRRRDQALADGDRAAVNEMYAEDVVFEDRRRGLGSRIEGRDAVLDQVRLVNPATTGMRSTVVATRGSRLALLSGTVSTTGGFEVDLLLLHELDASGRQVYNGLFDPDDLDAALAELEDRYAANEGAPYADVLRLSSKQREALRTGDFETYRALMDDDIVLVDNRPASLGEVRGREEVVRVVRALAPLVGGVRPRAPVIHAIAADRTLLLAAATGISEHGGEVEMSHLRLQQWRDGRVVRIEMFPVDDLDRARARFEALGGAEQTRHLENLATVALARLADPDALNEENWRAICTPDVYTEDRRPNLRVRGTGIDGLVTNFNAFVSLGFRPMRCNAIAVRGTGLALSEVDLADDNQNVIETLFLGETTPEGRLSAFIGFDADDVDAAYAELDSRFAAGEGAVAADIIDLGSRTMPVWNGQQWDALEALWEPDGVFDRPPSALCRRRGRRRADGHGQGSRRARPRCPSSRRGHAAVREGHAAHRDDRPRDEHRGRHGRLLVPADRLRAARALHHGRAVRDRHIAKKRSRASRSSWRPSPRLRLENAATGFIERLRRTDRQRRPDRIHRAACGDVHA